MSSDSSEPTVADYLRQHAPDLNLDEVVAFMNEHDKPEDEKGPHVEWAVRSVRGRREGDWRDGPSVGHTAAEMRRHDRG